MQIIVLEKDGKDFKARELDEAELEEHLACTEGVVPLAGVSDGSRRFGPVYALCLRIHNLVTAPCFARPTIYQQQAGSPDALWISEGKYA